jgi:hypothetical protein
MNSVVRLLAALLIGTAVIAAGVPLFKALDLDGLAYLGLVLVAMLAASLADRERFYGHSPPTPH